MPLDHGHVRRPNAATVMAALALVVALTGGGVAVAAHLEVRSSDIVDGQVKTVDLGPDAATGNKVAEDTLSRVPDAAGVRGLYGETFHRKLTGGTATVLQLRGLQITMGCWIDEAGALIDLHATTGVSNARIHVASIQYLGNLFDNGIWMSGNADFDTGEWESFALSDTGQANLVYTSPFGRTVSVDLGWISGGALACYVDGVAFGG